AKLGEQVGLPIDPWARADRLPLGAAQRAEIVAALHAGAKLLVLDEPTAVLTPVEVDGLLATLRRLASEGTTSVIGTPKLDQGRAVADAVTVLRAGETVATFGKGTLSHLSTRVEKGESVPIDVREIARAMVGADLPAPEQLAPPPDDAPVALALESVS